MRGRAAALLWISGLLIVLATPMSAQASWSAPFTISGPGHNSDFPDVAVNHDGKAVFAWTSSGAVKARGRSATGTLSPIQSISPGISPYASPDVAVDEDGNAAFAWSYEPNCPCNYQAQGRTRSPTGVLGAVKTLSPPTSDAYFPQVLVAPGGKAVFFWLAYPQAKPTIQARVLSASGTLGPVERISPPAHENVSAAIAAVDQSGNVVFAWGADPGTTLYTRVRSAAGGLSAVQTVSSASNGLELTDVAVNPAGKAVFIWWKARAGLADRCCDLVQGRARSATGVLSPIQTLSAAGRNACCLNAGIDQSGNALVSWLSNDLTRDCPHYPGCYRVYARARAANGALSAIQNISPAGENAHRPRVAVALNGKAVFVWQKFRAPNYGDGVYARARAANGLLGTIETLSPDTDVGAPGVGVDQSGNAVAVWTGGDVHGDARPIQAATGP